MSDSYLRTIRSGWDSGPLQFDAHLKQNTEVDDLIESSSLSYALKLWPATVLEAIPISLLLAHSQQ
jgi:hypothetical protein